MDFSPVRTWTLQEANAALPDVKRLLTDAREALAAMRLADQHQEDVRIVYGADVATEGNPGHGEWKVHAGRHREAQFRFREAMAAFAERGIEVKDVDMGLIDFYAMRGTELVFLCWKDGESTVSTWHSLQGGFAKRQSVGDILQWRRA